jgi:hypothetical protein
LNRKLCMITAAIAFIAICLVLPAYADDHIVSETTSMYTIATVSGNGTVHVTHHVIITDMATSPMVVGAIEISLGSHSWPVVQFVIGGGKYANLSVTTQEGHSVEYTATESNDTITAQIFSDEALLPGWNSQFIISYDIIGGVTKGILSDQFKFSNINIGAEKGDTRLTVVLPENTTVLTASDGAEIDGRTVTWNGNSSESTYVEYSSLPLPAAPIPYNYTIWGGLMLAAIVWAVKPRR